MTRDLGRGHAGPSWGDAALGDAHPGGDVGLGDAQAAAHLGEPVGALLGAQLFHPGRDRCLVVGAGVELGEEGGRASFSGIGATAYVYCARVPSCLESTYISKVA
jgi:hypothetical protein